ncbi:MAG: hypothetical protein QOI59_3512 [Gammaproteobacteria bacterium]|nr:hypothetical protein [Gammaproteobacteria bacterium]
MGCSPGWPLIYGGRSNSGRCRCVGARPCRAISPRAKISPAPLVLGPTARRTEPSPAPRKLKHELQGTLHRSPPHSLAIASENLPFSDQFEARPARSVGPTVLAAALRTRARASSSHTRPHASARSTSAVSANRITHSPPHTKPNRPHRLLRRATIRPRYPAHRNRHIGAGYTKSSRRHLTHRRLTDGAVLRERPL